jgi:type VII secretion-associated serine protease mycosin
VIRSAWFAALAVALTAGAIPGQIAVAFTAAPTLVRPYEWWIQRWGLEETWNITKGSGVVVAIVDSGVQGNLPDLAGSVLPGIDLSGGATDGQTDTAEDSHGTTVAELVAARGSGSTRMIGVAPEAKILPITLGQAGSFQDAGGLGSAHAIRWAVSHGASIVNMSYGGPSPVCPGPTRDAVRYALDHDVILVASSGNDGDGRNAFEAPAQCAGVVSVGAVDDQGRPWMKTGRQEYVDVAAPGVNIASVDRRGYAGRGDGTSYAAALVSGAVALLRARFPDMPARQIVTRLLATAKDAGPPGKDDQTGYGIVRPLNALTENVPADAPNPVYEEVDRLRGMPTAASSPAASAADGSHGWLALGAGLAGGAAVLAVLLVIIAGGRRRRVPADAMPHPPGLPGAPPHSHGAPPHSPGLPGAPPPGWGPPRGP